MRDLVPLEQTEYKVKQTSWLIPYTVHYLQYVTVRRTGLRDEGLNTARSITSGANKPIGRHSNRQSSSDSQGIKFFSRDRHTSADALESTVSKAQPQRAYINKESSREEVRP